jgi:large subunit ribosomal protein L8e
LGRATRCYATIIGHSDDGTSTRVRLPSGTRKTLSSLYRATVRLIAVGGRTEKPILKQEDNSTNTIDYEKSGKESEMWL